MQLSKFRYSYLQIAILLLMVLLTACATPSDVVVPTTAPLQKDSEDATIPIQPTAIVYPAADGEPPRNPALNTVMSNFMTADFSGAGTCLMCHVGLFDEKVDDVSITSGRHLPS